MENIETKKYKLISIIHILLFKQNIYSG